MKVNWAAWPAWLKLLVVFAIFTLIAWNYIQSKEYQIPQLYERMFEVGMMNATDLPYGWGQRRGVVSDVPGAVSHSVTYYQSGPGIYSLPLSQTILIYPSEEESKAAYQDALVGQFPQAYADRWTTPSELELDTTANEHRVVCLTGSTSDVSSTPCSMIARHGNLLSEVHGSVFEQNWLTIRQFRRLIERLDAKMDRANRLQGPLEP